MQTNLRPAQGRAAAGRRPVPSPLLRVVSHLGAPRRHLWGGTTERFKLVLAALGPVVGRGPLHPTGPEVDRRLGPDGDRSAQGAEPGGRIHVEGNQRGRGPTVERRLDVLIVGSVLPLAARDGVHLLRVVRPGDDDSGLPVTVIVGAPLQAEPGDVLDRRIAGIVTVKDLFLGDRRAIHLGDDAGGAENQQAADRDQQKPSHLDLLSLARLRPTQEGPAPRNPKSRLPFVPTILYGNSECFG